MWRYRNTVDEGDALRYLISGDNFHTFEYGKGFLRLILVIGEDPPSGKDLYSYVVSLASKHRVRDVVIHVVSTYGRPYYMLALRDFIQNNISMGLTIDYWGSTPEDLTNLLRSLRKGGNTFKVCVLGRVPQEFMKVLESLEVGYECLKVGSHGF